MIQIRRNAIVRYTPEQMFDLVNDVEAYPRRFAWCVGARVLARETDGALIARLDLRLLGLTQTLTTRNVPERPQRLLMHLVEGPLRALEGEWTFTALGPPPGAGAGAATPPACRIALELDFDYSGLGGTALRLGFQSLATRMVDDFSLAAKQTYG